MVMEETVSNEWPVEKKGNKNQQTEWQDEYTI